MPYDIVKWTKEKQIILNASKDINGWTELIT
jgi:hypothetical protein